MAHELNFFTRRLLKSAAAPLHGLRQRRPWRAKGGDARVLMLAYHRVVADIARAEREAIHGLVVSAETFERHLRIVREDADVLTLDEAAEVLRGNRRASRTAAVITFDDGYRDVYEHAWPVLKRLGIPATVYLPTALISGAAAGAPKLLDHDRLFCLVQRARELGLGLGRTLRDAGLSPEQAARVCTAPSLLDAADELNDQPAAVRESVLWGLEAALGGALGEYPAGFALMTWEMVREMSAGGVTFGAHTERHPILTLESEGVAGREIGRSKQTLEEMLGRPARHFAYPNGRYNAAVKQLVAAAGFETAVTTARHVNRPGCDLLELGRISLCEESTRGVGGRFSAAVARLRLAA
jgi:peptidoglycan/xylan/chitin deacetylase (PgdA/CDA1 family)